MYIAELEEKLNNCLEIFDDYGEKWLQPNHFWEMDLLAKIKKLRPKFEAEVNEDCVYSDGVQTLLDSILNSSDDFMIPGGIPHLCFALGHIGLRLNYNDEANDYFKEGAEWQLLLDKL